MKIQTVEEILNKFPEVIWDRWTGSLEDKHGIGVYGWIARDDGKSDFLFLRIDQDGPWLFATSSSKHSSVFSSRLNFDAEDSGGHKSCKRIEHFFPNVKSTK